MDPDEVFAPFAFVDLPKDMPIKDGQGNYIRGVKAHIDHDEDGYLICDIRYPHEGQPAWRG